MQITTIGLDMRRTFSRLARRPFKVVAVALANKMALPRAECGSFCNRGVVMQMDEPIKMDRRTLTGVLAGLRFDFIASPRGPDRTTTG
jgi:hypothetical protein